MATTALPLRRPREPPRARGGARRRPRRRGRAVRCSAATTRCSGRGRSRRSTALRELPDATWIRGNVERWTADPRQAPDDDVVQGAIAACRDALGEQLVAELGGAPRAASCSTATPLLPRARRCPTCARSCPSPATTTTSCWAASASAGSCSATPTCSSAATRAERHRAGQPGQRRDAVRRRPARRRTRCVHDGGDARAPPGRLRPRGQRPRRSGSASARPGGPRRSPAGSPPPGC